MALVRFACFEKSSKDTHRLHAVQDHRPQCAPGDTFGYAAGVKECCGTHDLAQTHCTRVGSAE